MRLSLVIPCYNEEDNLPLLLDRCKVLLKNPDIEVLLVDNGSTDNTQKVLKKLLPLYPGCRSIRVKKNRGYGFGILAGLKASSGEVLGWTHADLQTDPKDALQGLYLFEKHGDNIFVKGKRFGRPFIDIIFTLGMSLFETILLRRRMWDINAQPTMFSRRFFESWVMPPEDFSLDLYSYYKANIMQLKVLRFPVNFEKRAHGVSSWNVDWTSKCRFIRRTIDFSFQLKKSLKS